MNAADREEFFALIANVYAFYSRDFSPFVGMVWWNAMQPYDLAAVNDALGRHCANPDSGQYLPKPGDVVRMLQGSSQDSALVAWAKVDKAVRQVGTYSTVAFDDPIIHRVIHDMGGWVALGSKTEKEWPFVGKEFENRYRGFRGRSETPEYPKLLLGIAESENNQAGMPSQPPVLIGHAEGAQRVIAGGASQALVGFTRTSAHELAALSAPVREVA